MFTACECLFLSGPALVQAGLSEHELLDLAGRPSSEEYGPWNVIRQQPLTHFQQPISHTVMTAEDTRKELLPKREGETVEDKKKAMITTSQLIL